MSSDILDNQYWHKFYANTEIYQSDQVGQYTNEVLGWDQPDLNPGWIKKRASSAFCKMLHSMSRRIPKI